MSDTCRTVVSDADGIFADAIEILHALGHTRLANELDLTHHEYREMRRFRDEMVEEGRLQERTTAEVIRLKPALVLINGGKAAECCWDFTG